MSSSTTISSSPAPSSSYRTSHESSTPTPETEYSFQGYANETDLDLSNDWCNQQPADETKGLPGRTMSDGGRNGFEAAMMPDNDSFKGGQGSVKSGYTVAVATKCIKTVEEKMSVERAKELQFVFAILQQAPSKSCIMKVFDYDQDFSFNIGPHGKVLTTTTSEYCDGEDLLRVQERYEKARMRIPEKYLWIVYRDIVKALAYLHNGSGSPLLYGYPWRTIVHRDMKPSNIVLCSNPRDPARCPIAKLIDFDMAGLFDESRPETHAWTAGTYQYQPPEQWLDYQSPCATPDGDVYSLGATIYHLATGNLTSSGQCRGGQACMGSEFCGGHLEGDELEHWKAEREAQIECMLDDSLDPYPGGTVKKYKSRTAKRIAMHISSAGLGNDGYSEELDWWVGEALKTNPDARMKVPFLLEHMVSAADKRITEFVEELPRPLVEDFQQDASSEVSVSKAGDIETVDSTYPLSSGEKAEKIACLQVRIMKDPMRFRYPSLEDCKVQQALSIDVGKMLDIKQKKEEVDWQNDTARYESMYTKNYDW